MFGVSVRFAGLRAARLVRFQRPIVTGSKSLLDLLTDPTPPARAIEDEAGVPAPKPETLYSIAKQASRTDEVLRLVERHGEVMTELHLKECWAKLSYVVTYGGDLDSIKNMSGFDDLLRVTSERSHSFSPKNLVFVCRLFPLFQLPADSNVVSSLLPPLKTALKDLTLVTLLGLWKSLAKVSGDSKHLDVIKLSLPVIFQAKVRQELDVDDALLCRTALYFALTESIDTETCVFICNFVLPSAQDLTVAQAFRILESIAHNETSTRRAESIRQLLNLCVDKIARNITELDEDHIETVLECCRKQRVGTRALFDALWPRASTWSTDMKIDLLKASFRENYLTLPVAEFATEVISSNKEIIGEIDILKLAQAVAFFALSKGPDMGASHELCKSAAIELMNADSRIDAVLMQRPHLLAEFSLYFAVVGLFPEKRLRLLFDKDFQRSLCHQELSYMFMVELEQCVNLCLEKSHPYQVISELKALAERDAGRHYLPMSLSDILRVALGGEQFVATRVKTPLGTPADFIVAMRRGEYAMGLPDDGADTFGKIPAESKVVAIIVEYDGSDNSAFNELRNMLRKRNLLAQNIGVLTINLEKFEKLPIRDRTPFVMKSFKEVVRDAPVYSSTPNKCYQSTANLINE